MAQIEVRVVADSENKQELNALKDLFVALGADEDKKPATRKPRTSRKKDEGTTAPQQKTEETPAGEQATAAPEQQAEETQNNEGDAKEISNEEMREALNKVLVKQDNDLKLKAKAKLDEVGAKNVLQVKPEDRQGVIDYFNSLV